MNTLSNVTRGKEAKGMARKDAQALAEYSTIFKTSFVNLET